LRSKLDEYYISEGRESPIRIQLRKGSYVPTFEHRNGGMTSGAPFMGAAPRRAIGIGAITVFNGGATHDAAIEDVKRRIAHVLIREGCFLVSAEKPDAVVDGSMHFHADRVNVILQLLNTADSSYVWSEQVDCKPDDLSPVEGLARALNRALLAPVTGGGARVRHKGTDRHGFDSYLQGRYHWKIGTPESIRDSVPLFTKAIDHDRDYAAAWAALSQSLLIGCLFGYTNSAESCARMKEAALRATELKDNLPEAHLALGGVLSLLDWDWPGGERELQRAIQLAPSDPSAHVAYGLQLACRRMLDAAVSEVETALELDPASLVTNFALGWLHTVRGRYDEALVQHRLVAQIAPDFPLSYLGLGWAYLGKEMYRDAAAYFTSAANLLKARPLLSGCLGYCYARMDEREEALQQLRVLERDSNVDSRQQLFPVNAAAIYAGLGDMDRALKYLEEAVKSHGIAVALRTLNPEFNSLRAEPRFQEVLRKMGVGVQGSREVESHEAAVA
jgi:tetratricopeptide (TPR) repeat protein